MQKVFGSCAMPSEAKADEPLQTRKGRYERVRKVLRTILKLEEGEVPDRSAKGREVEGRKKKRDHERVQEATGGIYLQLGASSHKKACGTSPNRECWKTEERDPKRKNI